MDPQTQQILLIVAAAVIVLLVIALIVGARRHKQREQLRERYGDEYDRTVAARGSKRAAVRDLREREQLHSDLSLRDLNDADRDLIRRHMATLQYRFVEDPADVLLQTGRVATEVLRAQGYPVAEDRDKALRLFSVDHPSEAGPLRAAIDGDHRGDVTRMRDTFLGVRRALQEVVEVSYVLGDATDSPADLGAGRESSADLDAGRASSADRALPEDSGHPTQ